MTRHEGGIQSCRRPVARSQTVFHLAVGILIRRPLDGCGCPSDAGHGHSADHRRCGIRNHSGFECRHDGQIAVGCIERMRCSYRSGEALYHVFGCEIFIVDGLTLEKAGARTDVVDPLIVHYGAEDQVARRRSGRCSACDGVCRGTAGCNIPGCNVQRIYRNGARVLMNQQPSICRAAAECGCDCVGSRRDIGGITNRQGLVVQRIVKRFGNGVCIAPRIGTGDGRIHFGRNGDNNQIARRVRGTEARVIER